ncbi:MAG: 23S rRNA (guanosine(2251)-2'-O)-methyltransferase RlmB [Alphaproteobacteria bacterium]|nr:23S rRNA (guanosine(2251)-2'-O)-methyltransferase RlmB [Alphaproteobacteria bacterium]MBU0798537.1 23S rRNA (guanosine(2251)-2'-O)-methyltransferase RlmB [Alphaproteobacteria bacterium]MBU0885708.1 23S rRNA (guanosine(2251)-2'-O)-methyltransferase RlmB [Alphaproteobacteria bacterium]MBU1813773.1 23S rRNA (guanosine(2251)-2'-O)-methyltransferase RlmB [Alphaproteobacteria bacterium]MBU2089203.1 23S rRNA (guanosine(2251)-2'-O)-methyltransferase RlmB [Alphaproteobacteria bacterium]
MTRKHPHPGKSPNRPTGKPSGKPQGKFGGKPQGRPEGTRPVAEAAAETAAPRGNRPARNARRGGGDPERYVWGVHAVRAALANPQRRSKRLLVTAQARDSVADLLPPTLTVEIVERGQIDDLFPDAVHQGIALQVDPLLELGLDDVLGGISETEPLLLVVLDQVTDPHNVGAILRSAAAFGAAALIVQDRHSPALTGTLAKSASGALDIVPVVQVTNLARALDLLKESGVFCIGFDSEAVHDLHDVEPGRRIALVMGAEGPGLRRLTRERCDTLARLPTAGPIASLNVSNATAIALYDMARRR